MALKQDLKTKSKREVFYEHIILLTEGRLLMLIFVSGAALPWWAVLSDGCALLLEQPLYILVPLFATVGSSMGLWYWWYRCFGRLIVTEDEIIWKCPFMKTRRLHRDEIRYVGFDFRFSHTSLQTISTVDMAYFSTYPYPEDCVGENYKLRNSDQFIKFHASKRLCAVLQDFFPEPRDRIFAAAYDSFVAQEKRRRRRWQAWRRKLKNKK